MTLGKLLTRAKQLFSATYPDELLADWAAQMDGLILHEDYLRREYETEYNPTADERTVLLIPEPWEELYTFWILQKVHFMRGEYDDAQNFAEQWNELHREWLRNLLCTRPKDERGRPWLQDLAFCRRGSNAALHMQSMFSEDEIAEITITLIQNGIVRGTFNGPGEQIIQTGYWITLHLSAEDTGNLRAGSCTVCVRIQTVAGEAYESNAVQLRVMKSALDEIEAGAEEESELISTEESE